MPAIPSHSTPTVDAEWDGPAAVAEAPNDAEVLRYMHAWRSADGDPDAKSSYKLPHHAPGTDTAANLNGVRNALSRLPQTDMPDADRAGVERHLRRHLEDAGANEESMPTLTIARSSTTAERQAAARARAEAAGDSRAKVAASRSAPAGVGSARSLAFPAELRAKLVEHNGQERYHVEGHASVVDVPYEMWDMFGPYEEIIDARAFDETLAKNPDVAFLVNHRGVTMARTTNGTLKLYMDDIGLSSEAWLNPKRQDVSDLVVAIEDRDVTEMSFAFMLEEGWWSDDFETFKITKVDINRGDVSAVNYGANPYTNIAARSREILADLEHLPAGAARAALSKLQSRTDLAPEQIRDAPSEETREATSRGRSLTQVEALLID